MNSPSHAIQIPSAESVEIRVRGLVQGVGFRPSVWRLARTFGLSGEVRNDGDGVLIRACGQAGTIREFVESLPREAPPLSRIDGVEVVEANWVSENGDFEIVESEKGAVRTGVVPDAATCPACLADVTDPKNRRHRYAFANCTHCGPRLSIIRAIPYDRANTSMADFPLCADCAAEYGNPADRRFHAQPTACAVCGPRLWLEGENGKEIDHTEVRDAIAFARDLISEGAIVAIKGIGGFHLACDATNEEAVNRLRQRKKRYAKPFALMADSLTTVRNYAEVSDAEATLLGSSAAPIVVLDRLETGTTLAAGVAPGQNSLGFMLPYTPLHHLLVRDLRKPVVLTSGNRSDEPQVCDNGDARKRLAGIADYWLMHDRDIVNRLDDSVVRLTAGTPRLLRRARGYAPASIPLPPGFEAVPPVLAMGAELKNTFCLLKDGQAVLSPHIGDLDDPLTHADYRDALALLRGLFDFHPATVAVDAHPDYHATQWGHRVADEEEATLVAVQHHHAHLAACLAEHEVPLKAPPVLGVVLDGLGFGVNGELWGGEFLLADYCDFERLAHFAPVPLLGGAKAMREPWRNTYAHLCQFLGWDEVARCWPGVPVVQYLENKPRSTLNTMMARGVNVPPASSAGRLFDAVAAALGLCKESQSFEGQAAIELETLARTASDEPGAYGVERVGEEPAVLCWAPLWRALLDDLAAGVAPASIAARFHRGLIVTIVEMTFELATGRGVERVGLSGGAFQNRILLEGVTEGLEAQGLKVLSPVMVPANDGGLSLGQACVAAARALASSEMENEQ